jgi:hypothetical protein
MFLLGIWLPMLHQQHQHMILLEQVNIRLFYR